MRGRHQIENPAAVEALPARFAPQTLPCHYSTADAKTSPDAAPRVSLFSTNAVTAIAASSGPDGAAHWQAPGLLP